MIRKQLAAAASAGLTPFIGYALVVALVLGASVSGYVVHRWNKGTSAIAEAARLKSERDADRKTIQELKEVAQTLRQTAVNNALEYRASEQRLGVIAGQLESNLEDRRIFDRQQRAALDALAERRPDLRDLRLGPDVLQHWQDSNAGRKTQRAASDAAAGAAGQPAHAVPAAPAAGKRPGAGAAGQPRRSGGPVPQLQRPQRSAVAGDGRMASHRLGLVLQGGEGRGAYRGWLREINGAASLTASDCRGEACV